jgi:hypothetical protein
MTDAIRVLREAVEKLREVATAESKADPAWAGGVRWASRRLDEALNALEATASASQSPAHLGNQEGDSQ